MQEQIIKYRFFVTALASVLLLLVSYRFSVSHTIDAFKEQSTLQKALQGSSATLVEPKYLERKLNNLGHLTARYKSDTTAFRNTIVGNIALIAQGNDVQLTDVPAKDPAGANKNVMLQRLALKGGFFPLLKAYRQIERFGETGYIRSAAWKRKKEGSGRVASNKTIVLEVYVTGLK